MSSTRRLKSGIRLALITVLTVAILGAGGLYLFARSRTAAAIASADRDPQSGLSRAMTFTQGPEPKQ